MQSIHARRSVGTLVGLAAALAAAGTGAGARTLVASSASRLQVTQVEYRLILSRGVVKAGRVTLEAVDRGANAHDLHLRRTSSGGEIATPQLAPGQRWDGIVSLSPGVYRLWCSLPQHARLGMHTTLLVKR